MQLVQQLAQPPPEVPGVVTHRRHVQRQHLQLGQRPVVALAQLPRQAVRVPHHGLRVQRAVERHVAAA
jgi:hypothetical protein